MFLKLYFNLLFVIHNEVHCKIYATLSVNTNNAVHITDKKFFSVALDTAVIADHFKDFDMQNNRLYKLMQILSPGYLRIGGNMADRLYFSTNATKVETFDFEIAPYIQECSHEVLDYCKHNFPNFTMSGTEWDNINNFSKKLGVKILFDLNCLIRYKNGSWNYENANELISYSNNKNYDIDWQLGNEPNAFKHVFNYYVNASQLAQDFIMLRNILSKYPRYKNSILVGPDVTRPRPDSPESEKYLQQFLRSIHKGNIINAVSFHQYYLNGRIATETDFLNVDTFNALEEQINIVNNIVKNTNLNKLPVWLTETSSAYGGGAPGLSDSFVGCYLWLDKLGLSAKLGISVVVRQSIKRQSYSLINKNYDPNPDWWLSVLYKYLVGHTVLNCDITAPETIRLYCQCSTTNSGIVVFGINISNSTAYVLVEGINHRVKTLSYILTAKNNDLLTQKVLLNGKRLELSESADLPPFHPKNVDVSKPLEMPPYSLAFWTVGKNAKACRPGNNN